MNDRWRLYGTYVPSPPGGITETAGTPTHFADIHPLSFLLLPLLPSFLIAGHFLSWADWTGTQRHIDKQEFLSRDGKTILLPRSGD